ncbi:hypothetical protein CEXT_727241 [Caerostris extrusa]|uniref:Uncharacterized protein n=1 Tax=Caerostris extrusa TaxID=172846 RepID=A0AAV4PKP7_CAEEX|nr:hypothetical protein CEXT_727241 [Caerostris extrusa]
MPLISRLSCSEPFYHIDGNHILGRIPSSWVFSFSTGKTNLELENATAERFMDASSLGPFFTAEIWWCSG